MGASAITCCCVLFKMTKRGKTSDEWLHINMLFSFFFEFGILVLNTDEKKGFGLQARILSHAGSLELGKVAEISSLPEPLACWRGDEPRGLSVSIHCAAALCVADVSTLQASHRCRRGDVGGGWRQVGGGSAHLFSSELRGGKRSASKPNPSSNRKAKLDR